MGRESSKLKDLRPNTTNLKRRLSLKDRTVRQISSALLHRTHSKILTGPRLKRTIRPCSDGCEQSGLKSAVEKGHRACVMKHLISEPEPDPDGGRDKDRDRTLLIRACKQPEILEMLLEFGYDPNVSCSEEVDVHGRVLSVGETALHVAATEGNLTSVKMLVRYGANPEVPDRNNMTPLIGSCRAGFYDVTDWLFRYGLRTGTPSSRKVWVFQTLVQARRWGCDYLLGLIGEKGLGSLEGSRIYEEREEEEEGKKRKE